MYLLLRFFQAALMEELEAIHATLVPYPRGMPLNRLGLEKLVRQDQPVKVLSLLAWKLAGRMLFSSGKHASSLLTHFATCRRIGSFLKCKFRLLSPPIIRARYHELGQ